MFLTKLVFSKTCGGVKELRRVFAVMLEAHTSDRNEVRVNKDTAQCRNLDENIIVELGERGGVVVIVCGCLVFFFNDQRTRSNSGDF